MIDQHEHLIPPTKDPIVVAGTSAADPLPAEYQLAAALLRDWRRPTAERIDRELRLGALRARPRRDTTAPPAVVELTPAQRRALRRAPRVTSGSAAPSAYLRWRDVVERRERERDEAGRPAARHVPRGKRSAGPRPAAADPSGGRAIVPAPLPVALAAAGVAEGETAPYGLAIVDGDVLLLPRRFVHPALIGRAIDARSPDETADLPETARPLYERLRALARALQALHDRAGGRANTGEVA